MQGTGSGTPGERHTRGWVWGGRGPGGDQAGAGRGPGGDQAGVGLGARGLWQPAERFSLQGHHQLLPAGSLGTCTGHNCWWRSLTCFSPPSGLSTTCFPWAARPPCPPCPAEWAAPEMLRSEAYDERADVYSYGVVSCEELQPAAQRRGTRRVACQAAARCRGPGHLSATHCCHLPAPPYPHPHPALRSLSQVLWECLTGQQPWQGLHPMQVRGLCLGPPGSHAMRASSTGILPASASFSRRCQPSLPICAPCLPSNPQVVGTVGFQGGQLPTADLQGDPCLVSLCRRCMAAEPGLRPTFRDILQVRAALPLPPTAESQTAPTLAAGPPAWAACGAPVAGALLLQV